MVFAVSWARRLRRVLANTIGLGDPSERLIRDICRMQKSRDRGHRYRAIVMNRLIYRRYKCCVAVGAKVAEDVLFPHPVGIVIGEGAEIEGGCVIYQGVTLGRPEKDVADYPKVGKNCVIYANATLVGNISLAPHTVVGANAVVTRGSNLAGDVLVGVPARSLKHSPPEQPAEKEIN